MSSPKIPFPWYVFFFLFMIYGDFSIILIPYVQAITYNLTFRRVHVTIVAGKKQRLLHILSACM